MLRPCEPYTTFHEQEDRGMDQAYLDYEDGAVLLRILLPFAAYRERQQRLRTREQVRCLCLPGGMGMQGGLFRVG